MSSSQDTSLLRRFFLVAFGLCWLITMPMALQTQGLLSMPVLPPPVQWLIGFAPLLAVVWVTRGSDQRRAWLTDALRVRVSHRWYMVAAALPWVILAIALAGYALSSQTLPRVRFGAHVVGFALLWLVLGYGEETGWRAFALPLLIRRYGFWRGATLLGLLWCTWHYPKLLASPYLHLDTSGFVLIAQFSVQILVANYLLCWLFLRTRSALVATVFHASWNLVATVYALAATDPLITLVLTCITAGMLYGERVWLGLQGSTLYGRRVVTEPAPARTNAIE